MYGNMTREEMIQRLYEGNFTTGELERQLIAKLFEQCCGGGGVFKVECHIDVNPSNTGVNSGEEAVQPPLLVLNKTAGEIMDAHETSTVFVSMPDDGEYQSDYVITSFNTYTSDSTPIPKYSFGVGDLTFYSMSLDDYPTALISDQEPSDGGGSPT